MTKIHSLFEIMIDKRASDIHLISGQVPLLRIDGELEKIESHEVLENESLRELLYEVIPPEKKEKYEATGDVDFDQV